MKTCKQLRKLLQYCSQKPEIVIMSEGLYLIMPGDIRVAYATARKMCVRVARLNVQQAFFCRSGLEYTIPSIHAHSPANDTHETALGRTRIVGNQTTPAPYAKNDAKNVL